MSLETLHETEALHKTQPRKTISLLPALTVLFVISYGLMTMVIIEQGDTLNSQRWLITQLLADSTELTALKGKAIQQQNAEAQAKARAKTQSQAPSNQVPAPPQAKENTNDSKARKAAPQHPPKPASDATDARRIVVSI